MSVGAQHGITQSNLLYFDSNAEHLILVDALCVTHAAMILYDDGEDGKQEHTRNG